MKLDSGKVLSKFERKVIESETQAIRLYLDEIKRVIKDTKQQL